VALDEGSSGGSHAVLRDSMDEDQELPASVAWTSRVVIGGTERRDDRTSEPCLWSLRLGQMFMRTLFISLSDEDTGDTGGRISEPAEASRGMCYYGDGVCPLLISISCEDGPEGHTDWGCHRSR
jgi:hypothetical protein